MPLGGLAEQFSVRIAESRLIAGNFPWLMTASSFSLLWGCWFVLDFFSVCVCFWGCVWVGFPCFCFCSMPCFLLPSLSHITILRELAPTDCVGDPGSSANSGQLKDLNSVFLCPNHLATGQAGLILYLPPALALSRNSILFSVKVYSSCCSSGEQIRSDELALSHGKAILFKNV